MIVDCNRVFRVSSKNTTFQTEIFNLGLKSEPGAEGPCQSSWESMMRFTAFRHVRDVCEPNLVLDKYNTYWYFKY